MPATGTPPHAVQVTGLRKAFRFKNQQLEAVSGIDLTVATGQIFGFLGPNGAGKTTTLRILTTLLPADAGEAFVAGADVRRSPQRVRRRIGYVGQLGGADLSATGRENLLLTGRLYGMSAAGAVRRAEELIEALGLAAFAGRPARSYSGGQRRRLEVALGIMHHPPILLILLAVLTASVSATSSALGIALKQIGSLAAVVTGVQLPLTLLSGILLPLSLGPGWLQVLGHLNPMYYAVQAARALAAGAITTSAVGVGFPVTCAAAGLALWWGTRAYHQAMV